MLRGLSSCFHGFLCLLMPSWRDRHFIISSATSSYLSFPVPLSLQSFFYPEISEIFMYISLCFFNDSSFFFTFNQPMITNRFIVLRRHVLKIHFLISAALWRQERILFPRLQMKRPWCNKKTDRRAWEVWPYFCNLKIIILFTKHPSCTL